MACNVRTMHYYISSDVLRVLGHEDAITDMVIKAPSELTDEDILLTQNLNQQMLQAQFTL